MSALLVLDGCSSWLARCWPWYYDGCLIDTRPVRLRRCTYRKERTNLKQEG